MDEIDTEEEAEAKGEAVLGNGDARNGDARNGDDSSRHSNSSAADETMPAESADDAEHHNPQEATVEPTSVVPTTVDFNVTVHAVNEAGEDVEQETPSAAATSPSTAESVDASEQKQSPLAQRLRRRMDKRVRVARILEIASEGPKVKQGLSLPPGQYETCLIRRAIRKQEGEKPANNVDSEDGGEIYGDTSLGMKLSVISAKVIVQGLNPLSDGRASPAQLAGLVKRGDVLLSINGVSLVNLSPEELMKGLSPLSTADASGLFQRKLDLRLEAGSGLDLLLRAEAAKGQKKAAGDMASEMFSLFRAMVGNAEDGACALH